jgi:hypothetical protein
MAESVLSEGTTRERLISEAPRDIILTGVSSKDANTLEIKRESFHKSCPTRQIMLFSCSTETLAIVAMSAVISSRDSVF